MAYSVYPVASVLPTNPFTASVVVSEVVDSTTHPLLPYIVRPHCCRLYDARAESSDTHMEVADSMTNAFGTQPGAPDPPARNPGREVAVVTPVGRDAPSCTTAE